MLAGRRRPRRTPVLPDRPPPAYRSAWIRPVGDVTDATSRSGSPERRTDMPTEVFAEHRTLLVGVAYRMLGSTADAEDVVQDAWLRWSAVDHATVDDPREPRVPYASEPTALPTLVLSALADPGGPPMTYRHLSEPLSDRNVALALAVEMVDTHGQEAATAWFREHERLPTHTSGECPLKVPPLPSIG